MPVEQRGSVALARCDDYLPDPLDAALDRLFSALGYAPAAGERILAKPNLISAQCHGLSCTHPQVVAAACRWLLDHGARVPVADSPAFGLAPMVASRAGLADALKPLGLRVQSLEHPVALRLSFGADIGVSRTALEADSILNIPKLKAHGQMCVTAAVKNLFGCVVGVRKGLAHARFGERGTKFESMLIEVMQSLPPVFSLLDGILAMHRTGPIEGEPFPLGLLAASGSPVALDAAVYGILGLNPADVPLWRESQARGLPFSRPEELEYPLEKPEAFDASGFEAPACLRPVSFRPLVLAKSLCRRTLARFQR